MSDELSERRWGLRISIVAVFVFCLCVVFRNYYLWNHFCQTNYDLGIFIEMIQKNAQGILNPYINVRQIGQFNDHWTAMLSLLSPLSLFIPMPHFAFWLETLFLVSVFFYLLRLLRRNVVSIYQFSFLNCFFFLNRDIFEAAYFPIHPATWSALGLIIWCGLIYQINWSEKTLEKKYQILITLNYFVLTLMDEQNTFIGLTFALALLIFTKIRGFAITLSIFSGAMIWWGNAGRRLVFGPLFPYFKDRKITDPSNFLNRYSDFSIESIKTIVLHLIVLVPVFLLMRGGWRQVVERKQKLLLLGGLFGPLLLGRLLTNGFGRHYDIALIACWLGLFLILIPKEQFTRKLTVFSCVFFFALSVSKIKKAFTAPLSLQGLNCVRRDVSPQAFALRTEKIENAIALISERTPQDFKIVAMSNLGPNLLVKFPQASVFHLGEWSITNTSEVDWIIFERGQFGERLSISAENIESIIQTLMNFSGLDFVHQDDDLFMAHGKIPLSLLKPYYREQPQYE